MKRIKVKRKDINYFINLGEEELINIDGIFLLEHDEDDEFETQFNYENWEVRKSFIHYLGRNLFELMYYIVENNGKHNYYNVELEVIE